MIAEQILTHHGIALRIDDDVITYDELHDTMHRMASYIERKEAVRVVFLMHNTKSYIPLFLGCVLSGARPFLLHPNHPNNKELIQTINPDIIIEDGDAFMNELPKSTYEVKHLPSERELFVGFTSGTTGMPKGYRRTEQSWIDSFELNNRIFSLQDYTTYMVGGPLYHSLSLFGAISALYEGKTCILRSTFDAKRCVEQMEGTVIFGVPSMLQLMTRYTSESHAIFLSSGAKLEHHTLQLAKSNFSNMVVHEYFGSSEASYISYLLEDEREAHPYSVGKLFPEVSVRLEDGFQVSSPYMFTGYFGQSDIEGYIDTGDIAKFEGDYLYLLGRKHNRFIVGGKNVYPEEVERVLLKSGMLNDIMVTSKRHALLGEVAIAIIHPNEQYNEKILKNYVKEHLEKYKRPMRWIFDSAFIYTDSGKIARNSMKERYDI